MRIINVGKVSLVGQREILLTVNHFMSVHVYALSAKALTTRGLACWHDSHQTGTETRRPVYKNTGACWHDSHQTGTETRRPVHKNTGACCVRILCVIEFSEVNWLNLLQVSNLWDPWISHVVLLFLQKYLQVSDKSRDAAALMISKWASCKSNFQIVAFKSEFVNKTLLFKFCVIRCVVRTAF